MAQATDIIIIGAGICGLYAAKELSGKGKSVILLEAREAAGGRIRSINGNFSKAVDAGPEFIHGDLPITKALIKEAGGAFHEQNGKFYRSKNGKVKESEDMIPGWDRLMKELKSLKKDVPLMEFLNTHFNDETDKELKTAVINMAEGFDAADANRISTFAVREEWMGDSMELSYRIEGGYSMLVDYLTSECKKQGCVFIMSAIVKEINWKPEPVFVHCSDGRSYSANQVLVTVPVGILLASEDEKSHIRFTPGIPEKIAALKQMGFGPVIKINMEFSSAFWNDPKYKGKAPQLPDLGFLLSESEIPVWWTQEPDAPFLTGWAGGSRAEKLKTLSDEKLFEKAMASLSEAMNTPVELLQRLLKAHSVSNWGTDPFTKGAYCYETPGTAEAKKILAEPLEDKVFFAGEALGENMGTVEAALESAVGVLTNSHFCRILP
ncbi:MAG: FAD-dependent oxidoreductase [Bacteroidetes bacterium]|nr:FAD-dependent oxidoreductase [Bacteroidota bacterium]